MKNGYERLVRPLLFSLDAETAHHFTIALLRQASYFGLALRTLRAFQPSPKPKALFGLNFPNPIGLAAGLDKNGVAIPAWAALGFGFIEIGTVTAKAQPGNPKPRIFRLPGQQALINRLGFNNDGATRSGTTGRCGGADDGRCSSRNNIGKSRAMPPEQAWTIISTHFDCFDFADYIALNVSSPNTPGLRVANLKGFRVVNAIGNQPGTAAKLSS
jgi:dihydroorotate dehydrogenase